MSTTGSPSLAAGDGNAAPTRPACFSFAAKLLRIVVMFVYLDLLLWSVLLRPVFYFEEDLVPLSLFKSELQRMCYIRLHLPPLSLSLPECTYFSAVAVIAYVYESARPVRVVGHEIYGKVVENFEKDMMSVRRKFSWMCLVPWLVTFAQNWLYCVGEFLLHCRSIEVNNVQNLWSTIALMLMCSVLQVCLASEVVIAALEGWCAMLNINQENIKLERRARSFGHTALNPVFNSN